MDEKWKIEYYKTTNKASPVEEFIDKLEVKVQVKVSEMFDLQYYNFVILLGYGRLGKTQKKITKKS